VNEWETSDHQLVLEFGGPDSGCYKLRSSQTAATMSFGRWAHVVASLTPQRVDLFLDGHLVASTALPANGGTSEAAGSGVVRTPPASGRAAQTSTPLHVGRCVVF
jgi:hypothetical protein